MARVKGILTSRDGVIALITIALTLVSDLVVTEWSRRKVDSRLAIVDVAFAKNSREAQAVDVKVRNTGDLVAFLKTVRLNVSKQWTLQPQSVFMMGTQPSGEYEVVLPVMRAPFSVTVPLSHTVAPNETDQFRLNVNSFGRQSQLEHQLFVLTITLLFNETSSEVTSEPIMIAMGPDSRLGEMYTQSLTLGAPAGVVTQIARPNGPNVTLAKEIAALGVRKSPFAAAIVDAVLQSEKKTQ